jgi:hypothetical protein
MSIDYFNLDKGDKEHFAKQVCQTIWAGKHISSWFFLRDAARSSFLYSFHAASEWLKLCERGREKYNSLAAHVYIANTNYSLKLSGPLLSTIILSATCIEAFTRHCYVSVLRSKRLAGKAFCDNVSKFDKMKPKPLAQVEKIVDEIRAKQISESIRNKIDDLSKFRNDIMHSDPIYHAQNAELEQIKYGKGKKPRRYKYYPDVTLSNRPLSLRHAILATITHDELVEHIQNTSEDVNILKFLEEVEMTNNDKGLIWGFMPGIEYEQAKLISEKMNRMNKELNKVTLKEQIDFIRENI